MFKMSKILKKTTAMVMALVITSFTPLVDMAPGAPYMSDTVSAEESGSLYISEVKIGMGETSNEAKKELEAEGYTILKDGSGNNADLNEGAGSKSALKKGANDKIVYLGYKTTDDPSQAITDLAVMNMDGGYSFEDYNVLMDQQMESQIKPFVNRFISTLEEYRGNYAKSKSSLGHIRADYVRRMLNRLTDDDTGKPVGDLLLNKTKYELGDAAYNAMSEAEKKNHADILTMLMQANGRATLTMENLLSKATDTAKDTWVNRFTQTTLDDLINQVKADHPGMSTRYDLMNELDKMYKDTATGLLKKWDAFRNNVIDYEDKADEIEDCIEETTDIVGDIEDIDPSEADEDELEDYTDEFADAQIETSRQMMQMQVIGVCSYLDTVEYEDGTLLDFFSQSYNEVSGSTNIRKLYPIVDALSAGQVAGLDFLSFEDLFSIALADKNTYSDVTDQLEDIETASIYEGVDRGIYERGGVALTNDALRAKALETQVTPENYTPGTLQIVFWSVTAGLAIAAVAANVVRQSMLSVLPKAVQGYSSIWNNANALKDMSSKLYDVMMTKSNSIVTNTNIYEKISYITDRVKELEKAEKAGTSAAVNVPGKFSQYLSVGLAVIAVVATIVSTVITILDAQKFYETDYKPIPKFMVEEKDITAYDEDGKKMMIKNQTAYYRVVRCNRTEGSTDIEKNNYKAMGNAADLDGDIGKQWLALYAVKYENGKPILANSLLYKKNNTSVPSGYTTGIHEFGGKSACNLNKKAYLFASEPPSIQVFFKNEQKTVNELSESGSLFAPGSLAIGGGMGVIIGAVFTALVLGRKKNKVL